MFCLIRSQHLRSQILYAPTNAVQINLVFSYDRSSQSITYLKFGHSQTFFKTTESFPERFLPIDFQFHCPLLLGTYSKATLLCLATQINLKDAVKGCVITK